MNRRTWFGYQPAAVATVRQAEAERFEDELSQLRLEEESLERRIHSLRQEVERLTTEIQRLEQAEESVRGLLLGALDRESSTLTALAEAHEQTESEAVLRLQDLKEQRERIARVEAALLEAVRGALTRYVLQEEELA